MSADVIFILETWTITHIKLLVFCAYVVISVLSFACVECVNKIYSHLCYLTNDQSNTTC